MTTKKSQKLKTTSATVRKTQARTKKTVSEPQVTEKKISSKNIQEKALDSLSKYKNKLIILVIILGLAGLFYIFAKWFVVALVDKVPVTRIQFYSELEKRDGSQVKQQLITQQLVLNEAKNKGVNVSSDEINQEYKKVQDQVGADMLVSLLKQQNISDGDFKSQLKLQILVRKMFGNNSSVTDDDVNSFIKQSGQTIDESSPSAAQKQKDQAKEQLTNQKVSQAFQTWLQTAQSSSRVVKF